MLLFDTYFKISISVNIVVNCHFTKIWPAKTIVYAQHSPYDSFNQKTEGNCKMIEKVAR